MWQKSTQKSKGPFHTQMCASIPSSLSEIPQSVPFLEFALQNLRLLFRWDSKSEATDTGKQRERDLETVGRGGREEFGAEHAPMVRARRGDPPTQADVRHPGLPCPVAANAAKREAEVARPPWKKNQVIGRSD
jgi:hypothetical protein